MSSPKAKVDFMIIGAQKSATTTLFDILKSHPDLCACSTKEPEFFSHTPNWVEKINDYEKMFHKEEGQLAFEASTSYTAYPCYDRKIWEELWKYNPNLKFIYIVRDPLERIISAHRFLYRRGYADKKNINLFLKTNSYHINLSKYYFQIKPYIELFGAKNVKIVLFEDFSSNPEPIINEILDFLKVDRFQSFTNETLKSNSKERELILKTGFSPFTKLYVKVRKHLPKRVSNKLTEYLMYRKISNKNLYISPLTLKRLKYDLIPDIENFEKLIDRDLSHWKNKFNID